MLFISVGTSPPWEGCWPFSGKLVWLRLSERGLLFPIFYCCSLWNIASQPCRRFPSHIEVLDSYNLDIFHNINRLLRAIITLLMTSYSI